MHKSCKFRKTTAALFAILSLVLGPSVVIAGDLGAAIGVRADSATSNTASLTINSRTNFMGGLTALFDVAGQVQFRSGLFYAIRNYGLQPAVGTVGDATLTYMDVPLGLLWKFSDFGGAFVGGNLAFNVSSSCPGSCTNVATLPTGYQFGAQFKFAPQFGGALYYESMTGLVSGIDNPKAVVGQLILTFD